MGSGKHNAGKSGETAWVMFAEGVRNGDTESGKILSCVLRCWPFRTAQISGSIKAGGARGTSHLWALETEESRARAQCHP